MEFDQVQEIKVHSGSEVVNLKVSGEDLLRAHSIRIHDKMRLGSIA